MTISELANRTAGVRVTIATLSPQLQMSFAVRTLQQEVSTRTLSGARTASILTTTRQENMPPASTRTAESTGGWLEVFLVFLKLGLTSFGGPIAHLGYFREEIVARRKWIDDKTYSDLVALCQFLPGPASSQVGIALGLSRAGWLGGLSAWIGFTLPSAAALIAFGYGLNTFVGLGNSGVIHGLKVAAVAVVAQAVWGMARTLCPDTQRVCLTLLAVVLSLFLPTAYGQIIAIALTAGLGILLVKPSSAQLVSNHYFRVGKAAGIVALIFFFGLLFLLPIASEVLRNDSLMLAERFIRSGALVFGGGHVVLPLLQSAVVTPNWVDASDFLAGYGAAQAVPGPLFTFAAFLGTVSKIGPGGWVGGLLCLIAIFVPAALLIIGALPFWSELRERTTLQSAMAGANAGVVGVLAAALYDPVWTTAIHSRADFALALIAFVGLVRFRASPLLVVAFAAIVGGLLGQLQ